MRKNTVITFHELLQQCCSLYHSSYEHYGLSYRELWEFYRGYSEIEGCYGTKLTNFVNAAGGRLVHLGQANPQLEFNVKYIIGCIHTSSDIHLKFSNILSRISLSYEQLHKASENSRQKIVQMCKNFKTQFNTNIDKVKKDISKSLLIAMEKLIEHEYDHAFRVNEQTLMHLSEYRKLCEGGVGKMSGFVQAISTQDVKVSKNIIINLGEQLIQKYNSYGGQQIRKKIQHNNKYLKQSTQNNNNNDLTTLFNEYRVRCEVGRGVVHSFPGILDPKLFDKGNMRKYARELSGDVLKLIAFQMLEGYVRWVNAQQMQVQMLEFIKINLKVPSFKKKEKPEIKAEVKKQQKTEMKTEDITKTDIDINTVSDFNTDTNNKTEIQIDNKNAIDAIDTNTDTLNPDTTLINPYQKYENTTNYWSHTKQQKNLDDNVLFHLTMLQQISKQRIDYRQIDQILIRRYNNQLTADELECESRVSLRVSTCFVNILIGSLFINRNSNSKTNNGKNKSKDQNDEQQSILIDGFIDYLEMIAKFAQGFLQIDRSITLLLMLKKYQYMISKSPTPNPTHNHIQPILDSSYLTTPRQPTQKNKYNEKGPLQTIRAWSQDLIQSTKNNIKNFYHKKHSLVDNFAIMLAVENVGLYFNTKENVRDCFVECVNCAGFNLLKECVGDVCNKNITAQERFNKLIQGLKLTNYQQVINSQIKPALTQISKLYGVSQKSLSKKLMENLVTLFYRFINGNFVYLAKSKYTDTKGDISQLATILFSLQKYQTQDIKHYNTFYSILQGYLLQTEKNFEQMISNSLLSQKWEVEDKDQKKCDALLGRMSEKTKQEINSKQTKYCIDFCGVLCKHKEFMLQKFLIGEDINTNDNSKSNGNDNGSNAKSQFALKYEQIIKLNLIKTITKHINQYTKFLVQSLPTRANCPRNNEAYKQQMMQTFKSFTLRLNNLIFLKRKFQSLLQNLLEPEIEKLIFDVQALQKLIQNSNPNPNPNFNPTSTCPKSLQYLTETANTLRNNENTILFRVADATIFLCMRKIFQNLYCDQEKSIFESVITNKDISRTLDSTFRSHKILLEEWLALMNQQVPKKYLGRFREYFVKNFYQMIQCNLINLRINNLKKNVFYKIPVVEIKADTEFLIKLMNKYFNNPKLINECFANPMMKRLGQ